MVQLTNPNCILLDTSGLFSFLDTADERHGKALGYLKKAHRRVTHSYVLAELVSLAQARRFNRKWTLDFVELIADNPQFEVVWVGEVEHREALALLHDRADKGYSLCDAVSFVLMRRLDIYEALTTDHHFEQESFIRLL